MFCFSLNVKKRYVAVYHSNSPVILSWSLAFASFATPPQSARCVFHRLCTGSGPGLNTSAKTEIFFARSLYLQAKALFLTMLGNLL